MEENETEKVGTSDLFKRVLKMKEKQINRNKIKDLPDTKNSMFSKDRLGRDYVDQDELVGFLEKEADETALQLHGNDINRQLDLGFFPDKDRNFMLSYDKSLSGVTLNYDGFDWALFWGDEGSGKTTLAVRLAVDYMKAKPSNTAYFLSVSEWIRSIQTSYNDKTEHPVKIASLPRFVVLDDFDKTTLTPWQQIQLFHLVDVLYKSKRQVVVTLNRSLKILLSEQNNVDFSAMIDRVMGRVGKDVYQINRASYRLKKVINIKDHFKK